MSDCFVLREYPSVESNIDENGEGLGYIEIEDWNDIEGFGDWGVGRKATQHPTGPVEIRAVPHDGYAGPPHDYQDSAVPLVSKRMKEALEAAGVDNIDHLPITVRNTETGQAFEYFAFNLLGLVAAADYAKSRFTSLDGDFVGDSQVHDLAVDPGKARGMLMFRLKEKFSVILVHRQVKESIEAAGIASVKFVKPEDFMAL